MEVLIGKFETASSRIIKFGANTKKSVSRLDYPAAIIARIQLLDNYWNDFIQADNDRANAFYKNPKQFDKIKLTEFEEVEFEFITAKGELNEMLEFLRESNDGQGDQPDEAGAVAIQVDNIRMKAIEAPTFSGEIEEWVSFRDLFESIVTNNKTLSDVQRLQHLKMSCKGKASDIIRHIQVTAANFQVAWQELVRRFENKRILVSRMLERFLDLPAMTKECPIELARLMDGTSQTIRSLGALERPTDKWDDWLVVQTTRRLDYNTRLAWEKSIGSTVEMPTYNQLEEHLNGVLRSFEAVKSCVQTHSGGNKRFVKSFMVETKEGCFLCHGGHPLFKCPSFLAKSIVDRRQFVTSNGVCFNCLGSTRHVSRMCTSRFRCLECQRSHHTSLHSNDAYISGRMEEASSSSVAANSSEGSSNKGNPFSRKSSEPGTVKSHMCSAKQQLNEVILLPTAWVKISGSNGRSIGVRALIDQGSQASFVTEEAAQRLSLVRKISTSVVMGIGGASPGRSLGMVDLQVMSSSGNNYGIQIGAFVLPKLTAKLPNRMLMRPEWDHIRGLELADKCFGQPGRIDLLLGADVVGELLLNGVRHGNKFEPIAQRTIFGWVLSGKAISITPGAQTVASMHVSLECLLQRFWEQEEVGHRNVLSAEDLDCEKHYEETTTRRDDGRYVVELPFRHGIRDLGDSKANAIRRLLQIEKRATTDPIMYDNYKRFIGTYLELGHMERIPNDEIDQQPQCYLPHHAVLKPDSTSTKLRVVFDATLATSNGKGLNELLMVGPRLQENLTSILLRWRMHRIAMSADIEKMYRQIWVAPHHCDYQRIVWRDHTRASISHYRLKTVTYGTASAPYMAIKTLQKLANDESERFPLASKVVRSDFYVDDCLTGADTIEEAYRLKDELLGIMTSGGMRLLKWSSNSSAFLQTLPEDHRECRLPLSIDENDTIKALGIRWHPAADKIGYKVTVNVQEKHYTKRKILSEIAKLYDHLGLLALTVITAKILMQQMWLTGLGWDDELPEDIQAKWYKYQSQLVSLESVRIRRWIGFTNQIKSMQIHGFSDASKAAYAACVYVRVERSDGTIDITLLAAKTKVAPLKHQSIPRLELNGAVLLAHLIDECKRALQRNAIKVFAWTDSMVVLAWLRKHSNVWPTFVANRVSDIHSTMNAQQWKHVPGHENPADVASRGIMPAEVNDHSLWWNGPWWLKARPEKWPQLGPLNFNLCLSEEKEIVSCNVVQKPDMYELSQRYSNWNKLLRITAYCLRIVPRNRQRQLELQAEDIEKARVVWIRLAQTHAFGNVNALIRNQSSKRNWAMMKLNPILDEHGILRVGGRIQNDDMTYDERHPSILPSHNIITNLIIKNAHESTLHGGPLHTMGQLHQRYWILKERSQVRALIHKCVVCFKARPSKQQQLMGNLPTARTSISRPFLHTGIDYAGPIWSRVSRGRGQRAFKSWIAVFICLSTKAIHLELVSELSTAAFIAAFKRFVARRGRCSDVYCDNGTNFVGANRELRENVNLCTKDANWANYLSESGTKFHFAPAGSPHFNGLAESAVKMAKAALRKTIGDTKLTFEEMSTFLAQIEAVLNSRPLCCIPQDATEANVLTPSHFLIGQPLTSIPEPNLLDQNISAINRWKHIQKMVQHFWQRWSREYLHHMHQIHKWKSQHKNIEIGDVVLINDENLPPTKWKMGVVINTHPGVDGIVRVVSLRTSNKTIIRRAIVKLSVLPSD